MIVQDTRRASVEFSGGMGGDRQVEARAQSPSLLLDVLARCRGLLTDTHPVDDVTADARPH